MSDQREDRDDPKAELRRGLSHLWRAARGAALEIKREVDRTDLGKVIDEAGRELTRAATHVVDRLTDEVSTLAGGRPRNPEAPNAPQATPTSAPSEGAAAPPTNAPPPADAGVRIAVGNEPEKKPENDQKD